MDPAAIPTDAAPGAGRFTPGSEIALRYITRTGGVGMSWAARVVSDTEDLLALHIPRGAPHLRWGVNDEGQRVLVPAEWRREVLRLMFPGAHHSVWLFWENDADRTFLHYYVNFEEPYRRTAISVDTNDHTLDIVITPDRTWRWKDEEEFEQRVREGVFSEPFAVSVREEARKVLSMLDQDLPPFSSGWEEWRPEGTASLIPALPARWRDEPAVLWEQRHWAYLKTQ